MFPRKDIEFKIMEFNIRYINLLVLLKGGFRKIDLKIDPRFLCTVVLDYQEL